MTYCAGNLQCENQLNYLAVIFGLETNREISLRATPCFTRYYASKEGSHLKMIDMEMLRRKTICLKGSAGADIPKGEVFHVEEFLMTQSELDG